MVELTTIGNTKILIDIKDIRAVLESNNETSIFIYSDNKEKIPVKEDYNTVRKLIEDYYNR
jgi:hypothetical protein